MPRITVQAVNLKNPANSVAAWLAAHHPDIFLAAFQAARQSKAKRSLGTLARRFGRLADDGGDSLATMQMDFSGGDTPLQTVTVSADAPDFSLVPTDSGVQNISFDPNTVAPPADLVTDSPTDASGTNFLSSVGNALTSAGSTVGSVLSSAGTGVLSAIGAVGSFIGSSQGAAALTNLTKAYYGAQTANATAQAQQAVTQAQIARLQAGQVAAPITYTTNAAGQVVPVVATQTPSGTLYQPLTSSTLSNLTPSGLTVFLSQYWPWLALAGLGLWALA